MTKEEAKHLDDILRSAKHYSDDLLIKNEKWYVHGIKLRDFGYVLDGTPTNKGFTSKITETGKRFIASGGFTKQAEDEEFDRYHKEEATIQAKRANKISMWALAISAIALVVSVVTCQNEAKQKEDQPKGQLQAQPESPAVLKLNYKP